MIRIFLLLLLILITNCKFKQIQENHGFSNLEKKEKLLILNKSNKNDIIKIIGPPLTKSAFNNDIWIYIEVQKQYSGILNFGKKQIIKHDALILEINKYGLLENKLIIDMNNLNSLKFSDASTELGFRKNTFVFDFLSSMRQKINDPLGNRRKKINQQ